MKLQGYEQFINDQSSLTKYIKSKIHLSLRDKEDWIYPLRISIINRQARELAILFAKARLDNYSEELELLHVCADITNSVVAKFNEYTVYELFEVYSQYTKKNLLKQVVKILLTPFDCFLDPILWNVNVSIGKTVKNAAKIAFFMTIVESYEYYYAPNNNLQRINA